MRKAYKACGYVNNLYINKDKGITLISLIITIIILLILAGVTLFAFTNGGLLDRVKEASEISKEKAAGEKLNILLGEYQMQQYNAENALNLYDFFNSKVPNDVQYIENKDTDEILVTIDGYVYGINKTTLAIKNEGTSDGNVSENVLGLLIDYVQVGDYINYDAGDWTNLTGLQTTGNPTSQGQFGIYDNKTEISAVSKNQSITPLTGPQSGIGDNTYAGGWKVLSINYDTGFIKIVSAGTPITYYHAVGNSVASVSNINNFCNNNFVNSTYAVLATGLTYEDIGSPANGAVVVENKNLRFVGNSYWLASYQNTNQLWYVRHLNLEQDGSYMNGNFAIGIRPVVTLKTGLLTTGLVQDGFGNQAWGIKEGSVNLINEVQVGNYVNYDAGSWADTTGLQTTDNPTSQGQFGIYDNKTGVSAVSKNQSITPLTGPQSGIGDNTYAGGWKVLSINYDTGFIKIVSAGTPATYYHAFGSSAASVSNINNFCNNNFVNSTYAISATGLTYEDIGSPANGAVVVENKNLRFVGNSYWLASYQNANQVWYVFHLSGSQDGSYMSANFAIGIRPVVTLKAGLLTTGLVQDNFGNQAWSILNQ